MRQQLGIAVEAGVQFVPTAQVQAGPTKAAVPPDQAQQLLNAYSAAQLDGLEIAILTTGGITPAGFAFTRHLPAERVPAKRT